MGMNSRKELLTIRCSDGATLTVKFSDLFILPTDEIRDECCIVVNIAGELTPIIVSVTEYIRVLELKEQYKK